MVNAQHSGFLTRGGTVEQWSHLTPEVGAVTPEVGAATPEGGATSGAGAEGRNQKRCRTRSVVQN